MATYIGDKMVSLGIHKATDKVVLSKAEYEALEKKDPDTLYLVYDDHTLEEVNQHIDDKDIHVTAEEKEQFLNAGHTDEEINALIENSDTVKKELLCTSAVNKSVSADATGIAVSFNIDPKNLSNAIAIIFEFVGTITFKWSSGTVANGYLVINGTSSESQPVLFYCTSTKGSAHTWTWTDTFTRMGIKRDTVPETSGSASTPNSYAHYVFPQGSSTSKSISISSSISLGMYGQHGTLALNGTFNFYKITV